MEEENFTQLEVIIKKAYYRYMRHHNESTFAYLYFEGELSVIDLGKFLRVSDNFVQIDKNHYFIDFSHTKQDEAFKAAQNLFVDLDKYLNNTSSRVAIDTFDTSNSVHVVLNRLKQIMQELKKRPDSRIEDEVVLNELY